MKSRHLAVLSLLCLLLLTAQTSRAQSPTTFDQGVNPYSSLHGGDIDSVVLSNGNLLLHIPLISYPQRGKLHLGFFAAYDNRKIVATVEGTPTQKITAWAVQGHGVHPMSDLPWPNIIPKSTYPASYWAVTPDATHLMQNTSDGYLSVDATGFLFNTNSNVMIDRDGIRTSANGALSGYAATTTIEDPNGNLMTLTYNSGSETLTDSLGRSISFPTSTSVGVPTTDFSGCSGPLPTSAATVWNVPSLNGGTAVFKFCSAVFPLSMGFCSGNTTTCIEPSQITLPQSIVLPNLTTWTFAYDGFGNLSQVTLPTGGTLSYTWSFNSQCQAIATGLPLGGTESCPIQITSRSVTDATGKHTWTYSGETFQSNVPPTAITVTDPLGNQTVHTFGTFGTSPLSNPYEVQIQYYQNVNGSQVLLKTIATNYSYKTIDFQQTIILANVVPTSITTTWAAGGKTSQVQKSYDAGIGGFLLGQVTEERDYDYGNGAAGPLLRKVDTVFMAPGNSAYLTNNLLALPQSVTTYNGAGTQLALTTYGYDSGTPTGSGVTTQHDSAPPNGNTRGNQTSVTRWLNSPAGNLISTKVFLDTGEVHTSTTPKGNTTTFHPHMCAGAFPQVVTNAKGQATTYNYDCDTGLVLSVTDPNNLTTSHTYDALWRLTQTSYPSGGLDTYCYTDESGGTGCSQGSPPYHVVTTSKLLSGNMVKTDFFDGLGRFSEKELNSDPSGVDYIATTYDSDGRVASVTNPYRSTSDSTYGVTNYTYDALGRKTLVTQPDGSTVRTAYCGPTTLVTDEAGKWRRSTTDGLGRLIEVDEPNSTTATVNSNGCPGTAEPIWITTFTYDALNNLTGVRQNGSRQRSFVYDSLSRLLTSNNPEIASSGTACPINYTYDNDNNLATKISPEHNNIGPGCAITVTTTYSYDALERLTGKIYSNDDPSVSYTYDGSACLGLSTCANIGHRTSMTDPPGSESFAYDTVNRKSVAQRTTDAITKTTSYAYDYDGAVATLTYPSGHILNYTYNTMGQTTQAIDDANAYMLNGTYAPHGELIFSSVGVAANLNIVYNSRLQPCWVYAGIIPGDSFALSYPCTKSGVPAGSILDLQYNYNLGAGDNGNVVGVTNNRNTNRSQTFSYDQVNRLLTAGTVSTCTSGCWSQTFGYDPWANLLTMTATGTATPLNLAVNANNQITTGRFAYDSSGNETSDATGFYDWNAEGQLANGNGSTYTYDGDGRRVLKSHETSSANFYWYGMDGNVLDETDDTGSTTNSAFNEYIYVNGVRYARRDYQKNAYYYFDDQIGSARSMAYVPAGTRTATVCYEGDFYPYGAESIVTNTCPQNYKWTGKERDAETGNDNFDARYYSSVYGRFLSADWSAVPVAVPYANLTNPQTLNLYAIVHDNPESFADLDGHMAFFGEVWTGAATGNPSTTGNDQTSQGQAVQAQDQNQSQNQQQSQAPKPAPASPDGTPKPPPVPVPGQPKIDWEWHPDPSNGRGGTWGPEKGTWDGSKWGSPPSASWDGNGKAHWDVDNGKGGRQRYDENGKPMTPQQAHSSSSIASGARDFVHAHPVATGIAAGVLIVGGVAAIVFSGGTAGPPLLAAAAAF
jgi:RHS repeat-associated protein